MKRTKLANNQEGRKRMKLRIQNQNFGFGKNVELQIVKRKYNYAAHMHQYAELIIPLKGSLSVVTFNDPEVFSPGEAAFIFPYQSHEYLSNEYNEVAIFTFSTDIISEFFGVANGFVGERAVFTPEKSSFEIMRERVFDKENSDFFSICGCLSLMVGDYLRSVKLKEWNKTNDVFRKIVEYVINNISKKITVNDIANELNYSKTYLSQVVKSIYGDSIPTLISAIKTDRAFELFRYTDASCREICFACGFGSEISFSRNFKKIVGRMPSEYGKSIRTSNQRFPKSYEKKWSAD